MSVMWLYVLAAYAIASASADRGGSSLRGALEALQRRQRGRMHGPLAPQADYDALYEFVPPQAYPEIDYPVDVEDIEGEPNSKYIIKLLEDEERPLEAYEYRVVKKKNSQIEGENSNNKKESAFRERSHHSDNERLRDLFIDKNDADDKEVRSENDAEYALLLGQLWSKYKYNKAHTNNIEQAPQGVVKLYKEKVVKKRYPDNWGPIAFKRKRSSDTDSERPISSDYDGRKHGDILTDPTYNAYEVLDDDKDDLREEYAIAFQPLDDDTLTELGDDDPYSYDAVEKRFPVTKRSSGPYNFGMQKKRFALEQNKHDKTKSFRSSSGTDPRIINDLSKIFGGADVEMIKNPVKRSSEAEDERSHETRKMIMLHNNNSHEHINATKDVDISNEHHDYSMHNPVLSGQEEEVEHHEHSLHHPGMSGQEEEVQNHEHSLHHPGMSGKQEGAQKHKHNLHHPDTFEKNDDEDQHLPRLIHPGMSSKDEEVIPHHGHNDHHDKPIKIKKKSIDWTDYFGIDKRNKKHQVSFINDLTQDRLSKQYFDTFNKEVIYPLNSFRQHSNVKRNYVQTKPNEEKESRIDKMQNESVGNDDKRNTAEDNDAKLDNIDKKLKTMEGLIVDEALHYSNVGEELDSKEEQEMKEKLLSRLAAAYSLEKMRKALKEFKQSLQIQKTEAKMSPSSISTDDSKAKRVAVKKEKVEIINNELPISGDGNDDFENEQGAGHYLNGKKEAQFSEGYMGGSGRHRSPIMSTEGASGSCPVLGKIIQRCRGVDLLAGDRGQLFLPLCSLHQICYLCAEAPPTTCDLVFLSEADTSCEGDMGCQRAARSALMALRELHDSLADELDGECEANPCLPATLRLNIGWQRALQR